MQAGLITFSLAPNFGAFIQSLASNIELKRRGIHVKNYDPNPVTHYTRKTWRPQSLIYRMQASSYAQDRKIVGLDAQWIEPDGVEALRKVDVIFVGSDQVLNLQCLQDGTLDRVLLTNVPKVPKMGLAMSSYSNASLEMAGPHKLSELSSFTKLSFREAAIAKWIKNNTNIEGRVLPDPCFLLTAKDLEDIAQQGQSKPRKMKTLVAGYELKQWVPELTDTIDLPQPIKYVNFQFKQTFKFGLFTKGPLQAMNELLQAEVIVTNSFHFAVVGIIANKKVIVPHGHSHDGGERLRSLGEMLNFTKLCSNAHAYDHSAPVNPEVEKLRNSVCEYLDECLDTQSTSAESIA